eukprot:TRINITY_DN3927_c0_g1_i24.p1 TRINITY_DN3927_c0_g1~~TRINITY_DN3927_c0_g1_i24.p1  ORF type:complete len:354 (-),score=92.55 TRINITY_DN3927_c0_g1_i24:133-1194(-)
MKANNQEHNNKWICPQLPFPTIPFCLPSFPPTAPFSQPPPSKRFVEEREEEKPQAVATSTPAMTPPDEESAGRRERKAPFSITKSEAQRDKKAIRAEKNRLFAKESRDRKQMYVREIENQLRTLKVQVEDYKRRLSKYELIEKHLEFNYEANKYLEAVTEMVAERRETAGNNELFVETLKKFYTERTKDKQKALQVLSKAMVEMIMPFSVKMCLWIKESGIDIRNTEGIQRLVQEKVPHEEAQNIAEYVKALHMSRTKHGDNLEHLVTSGTKLKNLVRKIAKCQKDAQLELTKICNYMNKSVFTNFSINQAGTCFRITSQLLLIPELSNYSICNLSDSDFSINEETKAAREEV